MAWRIVKQPNGLYARFSDIVDDFTHYDMTKDEAIKVCKEEIGMGQLESEAKVQRADDNPQRFEEEMQTVKAIHGEKEYEERLAMLTAKSL